VAAAKELGMETVPCVFIEGLTETQRRAYILADIFGGSGTTLIAAEQLKRRCRIMELDPHYCDVIINRWEEFTGGKAVKIDG